VSGTFYNVRDWHKGARPLEFERRAEGIAHGQAKQRPSVPVNAIHDPSSQSPAAALRFADAAAEGGDHYTPIQNELRGVSPGGAIATIIHTVATSTHSEVPVFP
jgi:hypothetical protein